jgi:Lysine methyltransferase
VLTDSLETFLLFTQENPSQDLGFVDSKAINLEVDISRRSYTIRQSPGLLTSDRDAGTTGAVLWKITPLVANWLSSIDNFLWDLNWLRSDSNVVELGCGISALIPLCMAPLLPSGFYALTDQAYVMRILHHNLLTNPSQRQQSLKRSGQPGLQVQTLTLDWESDAVSNVAKHLGKDREIDLLVACDCIYNEHLICPFVSTCASLCALCAVRSTGSRKTGLLVAQQLRSEEVLQMWLEEMLKSFLVFRIPERLLQDELRKGYVLHFALLR